MLEVQFSRLEMMSINTEALMQIAIMLLSLSKRPKYNAILELVNEMQEKLVSRGYFSVICIGERR